MTTYSDTALTLRPWSAADAPAVLAAFRAEDMIGQAGEPIVDLEAAKRWIRNAAELTSRERGYAFAVVDADDMALGNVMLTNIDRHDCGWVSYWTAAPARGRKVASDALAGLVGWAHDTAAVYRLELGHRLNNPGSGRVAANAGFHPEGVERAKLCYDTMRYDVQRHARLAVDTRPTPSRQVRIAQQGLPACGAIRTPQRRVRRRVVSGSVDGVGSRQQPESVGDVTFAVGV